LWSGLAGPDGALAHLQLDDAEPLRDLALVGAGAVAAQEILGHVFRDGIAPLEAPRQVLTDDVALEGASGELVERVEFGVSHAFAPSTSWE
jgi:hypothetical protein